MVLEQKTAWKQGAPNRCCHSNHPDRIQIAFDDHRLVANAGLLLPATLALHLGLSQLVQTVAWTLGDAPGRANPGDKIMTLVASALAGGDCIDDADALRAGGAACALGSVVKAPSTLGHLPAQLSLGPRPPTGPGEPRVAGTGMGRPEPDPAMRHLTIDLDSTICETYGLAKEGAPATTATPASPGAITRCWPSPPAPATC